jgi:hydrogenase expression/formation protein HypC
MCLGIPGQILEIVEHEPPLAIVSVGGVRRVVNLSCIVDAVAVELASPSVVSPAIAPSSKTFPQTSSQTSSQTSPQTLESYIGDWVLVHVGFALERLDEAEAQATLDLLGAIAAQADPVSA